MGSPAGPGGAPHALAASAHARLHAAYRGGARPGQATEVPQYLVKLLQVLRSRGLDGRLLLRLLPAAGRVGSDWLECQAEQSQPKRAASWAPLALHTRGKEEPHSLRLVLEPLLQALLGVRDTRVVAPSARPLQHASGHGLGVGRGDVLQGRKRRSGTAFQPRVRTSEVHVGAGSAGVEGCLQAWRSNVGQRVSNGATCRTPTIRRPAAPPDRASRCSTKPQDFSQRGAHLAASSQEVIWDGAARRRRRHSRAVLGGAALGKLAAKVGGGRRDGRGGRSGLE